jgi:hypothetical protein
MTPEQAEAWARNGHDARWRVLDSGIYKIMIKDLEGNPSGVIPFIANAAQREFVREMHYRNIILKDRQRGFTTLFCIMWLDFALFNHNVRCGIVAQDDPSATAFFRDKVKFAYDNLDPELKAQFPIKSSNTNELVFSHTNAAGTSQEDSGIRVATSFASATLHRLLISEYGKICAKTPEKANEIVIGTIPTVPENGVLVIESTGEGAEGDYYERVLKAEKLRQEGRPLNVKDFKFHFSAWWSADEYEMHPTGVVISPELTRYFNNVEDEMGCVLTPRKRAWYAATLEGSFSGQQEEKMYSQYPSTPNEPFFVSNEGNYHRKQMAIARKDGRIRQIPLLDMPVNTFWDVGQSDGTAIWFHQQVGMEDRFIDYFEAHGKDDTQLATIAVMLQNRGYIYNKHFLPHDAYHTRQNDKNESIADILERLCRGYTFEKVDKVTTLVQGIQLVWDQFKSAYFDVERCALGISRLDTYKKKRNRAGGWSDEPDKSNGATEGADAFRAWAQAKAAGNVTMGGRTKQSSDAYEPSPC